MQDQFDPNHKAKNPPPLTSTVKSSNHSVNSTAASPAFASLKQGSVVSDKSFTSSVSQHSDERSSLNSGTMDMKSVSEVVNGFAGGKGNKSAAKDSSALSGNKLKAKGENGLQISSAITHGSGPWNDASSVSPILARKFENNSQAQKIHVVTVGKPFHENSEEVRRIKICEHQTMMNAFDFPFVDVELRDNPVSALAAVEPFLRNPYTERKLVDKIMSRATAVKALTAAQNTLVPMYGEWVNSTMVEEKGIAASSDTVYLVEFCLKHGTVARSLPAFKMPAFKEDVKSHLAKNIGKLIEKLWDCHTYGGFSFALVAPLGKGDFAHYP